MQTETTDRNRTEVTQFCDRDNGCFALASIITLV
jgi:hypothetical protein